MADDPDQFAPPADPAPSRLRIIPPKQSPPPTGQPQSAPSRLRIIPPKQDSISQRMLTGNYPKSDRQQPADGVKSFGEYASNIWPDIKQELSKAGGHIAEGLTPGNYLTDPVMAAADLGLGAIDALNAPMYGAMRAVPGAAMTDWTKSEALGDITATGLSMISPFGLLMPAAKAAGRTVEWWTGVASPGTRAAERIQKRVNESEESAMDRQLAEMRSVSPEAVIADLPMTGQLPGLIHGAGLSSKMAQDFVRARQEGGAALDRAYNATKEQFGDPNVIAFDEAQRKERAAKAGPLYQKAWNETGLVDTEALQGLLAHPTTAQLLKTAKQRHAMSKALPGGDPTEPLFIENVIRGFDPETGKPILGETPTMQTWGHMYQALNQEIRQEKANVAGGGNGSRLYELNRYMDVLRAELSRASPAFKAANEAYKGDSKIIRAREWGEKMLGDDKIHGENARAALASMNEAEKESARRGLAREITWRMKEAGIDESFAPDLLRTPAVREKIAPFFRTEKDQEKFYKFIENEYRMHGTYKKFGNAGSNESAIRANEEFEARSGARKGERGLSYMEAGKAALKMAAGDVTGAYPGMIALRYLGKVEGEERRHLAPEVTDSIAQMVFSNKMTFAKDTGESGQVISPYLRRGQPPFPPEPTLPGGRVPSSVQQVRDAGSAQRQAQIDAAGARAARAARNLGLASFAPGMEDFVADQLGTRGQQ